MAQCIIAVVGNASCLSGGLVNGQVRRLLDPQASLNQGVSAFCSEQSDQKFMQNRRAGSRRIARRRTRDALEELGTNSCCCRERCKETRLSKTRRPPKFRRTISPTPPGCLGMVSTAAGDRQTSVRGSLRSTRPQRVFLTATRQTIDASHPSHINPVPPIFFFTFHSWLSICSPSPRTRSLHPSPPSAPAKTGRQTSSDIPRRHTPARQSLLATMLADPVLQTCQLASVARRSLRRCA